MLRRENTELRQYPPFYCHKRGRGIRNVPKKRLLCEEARIYRMVIVIEYESKSMIEGAK